MSITDAEYAMLCNAVYRDKNFISPENYGFISQKRWEDAKTGFCAEVFQRDIDLVIVFSGTKNELNFKHDIQWKFKGSQPPELEAAIDFYDNILREYGDKGLTISLTGHSLGASAVQYVNANLSIRRGYQVKGVAFAPAGVGDLFLGLDPSSIAVKNYIRDGDVVPETMNKQLGYKNVYLPTTIQSYEVQYTNGIGEIIGTFTDPGILVEHNMLGYWVDVGNLTTRTMEKPISLSHYAPLPEKQLEEMQAVACITKEQCFNFNIEIGYNDSIQLQIGNQSYKTELYGSDLV